MLQSMGLQRVGHDLANEQQKVHHEFLYINISIHQVIPGLSPLPRQNEVDDRIKSQGR